LPISNQINSLHTNWNYNFKSWQVCFLSEKKKKQLKLVSPKENIFISRMELKTIPRGLNLHNNRIHFVFSQRWNETENKLIFWFYTIVFLLTMKTDQSIINNMWNKIIDFWTVYETNKKGKKKLIVTIFIRLCFSMWLMLTKGTLTRCNLERLFVYDNIFLYLMINYLCHALVEITDMYLSTKCLNFNIFIIIKKIWTLFIQNFLWS
jgi:hypothetical protein